MILATLVCNYCATTCSSTDVSTTLYLDELDLKCIDKSQKSLWMSLELSVELFNAEQMLTLFHRIVRNLG